VIIIEMIMRENENKDIAREIFQLCDHMFSPSDCRENCKDEKLIFDFMIEAEKGGNFV
jgi:hypothetical protein